MSWYRNTVWFVKGLREYTRYGRRPPGAREAAWGGRSARAEAFLSVRGRLPAARPCLFIWSFYGRLAAPAQAGGLQPRSARAARPALGLRPGTPPCKRGWRSGLGGSGWPNASAGCRFHCKALERAAQGGDADAIPGSVEKNTCIRHLRTWANVVVVVLG